MKARIDQPKNFMWTVIGVQVDKEKGTKCSLPLEGIYQIKPENTSGTVREYFEMDLVNGADRLLMAVREASEDYYEFEMIMNTTSVKEFVEHEHKLVDFVINSKIEKPTVVTFF